MIHFTGDKILICSREMARIVTGSLPLLGILLVVTLTMVRAGELTFELPDNERMCFHEIIEKNVKCTLEFQVINENTRTVDVGHPIKSQFT